MVWTPPQLRISITTNDAPACAGDSSQHGCKVDGAHILLSDQAFWELHEEVQVLGKGSFGTVKLSRVRSNGNLVAIKEVAKGTSVHDGSDINETQEAQVLTMLGRHTHAGTAPARVGGRHARDNSSKLSFLELQDAMRRAATPSDDATAYIKACTAASSSAPSPATVLASLQTTPGSPYQPPTRDRPATVGPATADSINRSTPQSTVGGRGKSRGSSLSVWQLSSLWNAAPPESMGADLDGELPVPPEDLPRGLLEVGLPLSGALSPLRGSAEESAQSNTSQSDACRGAPELNVPERDHPTQVEQEPSNTVKLLDVYDTPSTLYLVMRAEMGGDLAARLASLPGRVCPEPEARTHITALLRGLESAHAQGIVHRDVKSANVFLSGEGVGRLGDFGIAANLPQQSEGGAPMLLTAVCGTHNNMAPEMVLCGHGEAAGYDTGVDMWQMGLLLFEMLFGTHPFARDTEIETLAAILAGKLVMPEAPATSEAARDLVRSLLVIDPSERQTASQCLRHPWLCES